MEKLIRSKKLLLLVLGIILTLFVIGMTVFLSREQVSQEYRFQERQLTALEDYFSDAYSISNLRWSPTGATLIFQVNTKILQINRDGTKLRELVEDGIVGDWSPDGQSFVYVTRSAGTDRIILMNLRDSSKKILVSFTPPVGKGGLGSPSWNPTKRELAYIQSSYSASEGWVEEIWKVNIDNTEKQLFSRDQKKKARLDWNFTGEYILFENSSYAVKTEEDYGPPGELWVMEVQSRNAIKVFGDANQIVTDLAVHPLKNSVIILAYAPNEGSYTLWQAEFLEEKINKLLGTSPLSFSLSSEGKLFAIEQHIGENDSRLWIFDISQGSGSMAVSAKPNTEYRYPVWDPIGSAIALVGQSQGIEEIFLLEK